MDSPLPPAAEHVDLFDYGFIRDWVGFVVRAPTRHRWLALVTFLLVASTAVLASWAAPVRYQVQGKILAQRSPLMSTLSNPGINREWDAPTRAAREVVIRRDNLVALCKQTDFVRRYLQERSPAVRARDWLVQTLTRKQRTEEEVLDGLVDSLESRLWVVVSQEGAVTITLEWSNRETAYQLVEAALQSFLEARHSSEVSAVEETIAILESHDAAVQREIEARIEKYEEKERESRPPPRPAPRPLPARPRVVHDEDLSRLEATVGARRRALADLEDFRQARLTDLRTQLVRQLDIYADQHPSVLSTRQAIQSLSEPSPQAVALQAEVQDLEGEINRRRQAIRPSTSPDVGPVDSSNGSSSRSDLWGPLINEPPRLEYERRELELLMDQHSNLQARIDAARVEIDTARSVFKYRYSVITPPQLPKRPVKAYGLLFLIGGLIGGIGLTFFVAAAKDLHSGRVVEPWQLRRKLELPVLAHLRR